MACWIINKGAMKTKIFAFMFLLAVGDWTIYWMKRNEEGGNRKLFRIILKIRNCKIQETNIELYLSLGMFLEDTVQNFV